MKLLRKLGTAYRIFTGRDSLSTRTFVAEKYLRGRGIEVGALDKPMPVARGVQVLYVDRLSREDLLAQYPEMAGKKLAPIDIVTDGETLREIGDGEHDFIIANHFLEHCEDPIGALKNFLRVVKPGGILFLTLPDKRFTFDRDREETSFDHLLRDHREGPKGSRREHFHEWVTAVGKIPEGPAAEAEVQRLLDLDYSIHFHVFTGTGALDTLQRLRRDERMGFGVEAFFQNSEEFIFVLRKDAAS